MRQEEAHAAVGALHRQSAEGTAVVETSRVRATQLKRQCPLAAGWRAVVAANFAQAGARGARVAVSARHRTEEAAQHRQGSWSWCEPRREAEVADQLGRMEQAEMVTARVPRQSLSARRARVAAAEVLTQVESCQLAPEAVAELD